MNKEREWLIEYLKDTIVELRRVKKPNYIPGNKDKCIEEINKAIELIIGYSMFVGDYKKKENK